jgi:mRNA interferase RelE/StbE
MNYQVFIRRRAQKSIAAFPKSDREAVRDAIVARAANPRPPGASKLTDRNGCRSRVRSYRVINEIDDVGQMVTVLRGRPST